MAPMRLREVWHARAGLLLGALGPVVTAAVVVATRASSFPGALAAAGLASFGAVRKTRAAVLLVWVAIIFVPVYWSRPLAAGVVLVPVTVGSLLLLPAALSTAKDIRFGALDVAVALFFIIQAVSYLINFSGGSGSAVGVMSRLGLGYAVFRALSLRADTRRDLVLATIGSGLVLALFAFAESRGLPNPWFSIRSQFEADLWARAESRFGAIRSEASFGHPIALGMFFSTCIVLIAGIAAKRGGRLGLVGAVGALLLGAASLTTLSRTPLLTTGVGLVVLALGGRAMRHRLVVPMVCGATALALLGPGTGTLGQLVGSLEGPSQAAQSVEYRTRLFDVITDPAQFSLLGKYKGLPGAGPVNSVARQIGFPSFDNYFGLIYLVTGAIALVSLLVACALVWREAWASDHGSVDRGWACAAVAGTVGLTSIGLLAQHGDLFWLGIALVASARQERLLRRHARLPDYSGDPGRGADENSPGRIVAGQHDGVRADDRVLT